METGKSVELGFKMVRGFVHGGAFLNKMLWAVLFVTIGMVPFVMYYFAR